MDREVERGIREDVLEGKWIPLGLRTTKQNYGH